MLAVREGHSSIVDILLAEPGIDVTRRDVNGSTALHLACRYGQMDLVQQLLDHPGGLYCLEWPDKWGETPLLTATRKGHLRCVKLLLQVSGICLATKDGKDKSLVEVARETGNAELVECLRIAVRARYGEEADADGIGQVPLSNGEEISVTQSTESLHIRNDIYVQETVAEIENANEIKQEVEDAESSRATAVPEDKLREKRKRSPSPSHPKKSLRENKDSQNKCKEVTPKANENVEADQTFIDYNHSVRKLLLSDDIPMDVVFKVYERREDNNVSV